MNNDLPVSVRADYDKPVAGSVGAADGKCGNSAHVSSEEVLAAGLSGVPCTARQDSAKNSRNTVEEARRRRGDTGRGDEAFRSLKHVSRNVWNRVMAPTPALRACKTPSVCTFA